MDFKTQYDSHPRVFSQVGSRIKKLFQGHYDEDGRVVLDENGEENLYDFIQSHRDSVDINVILKRFQNGEVDLLSKVQGFYADVTDFPKTMAEALNRISDAERVFKSLPLEVRERFNHSFTEFLAASEDADFLDKLGYKPDNSHMTAQQFNEKMVKKEDSVEVKAE